jgi:hypothetical protein
VAELVDLGARVADVLPDVLDLGPDVLDRLLGRRAEPVEAVLHQALEQEQRDDEDQRGADLEQRRLGVVARARAPVDEAGADHDEADHGPAGDAEVVPEPPDSDPESPDAGGRPGLGWRRRDLLHGATLIASACAMQAVRSAQ